MSTTATKTRRHELDHLRVLATLGVVLLHAGAAVVVAWRSSEPDLFSNFNVGNLADAGGRFAVNCFIMTSGALLLDPVRRFVLRPQFLRVALPTLTWIAVYVVANAILTSRDLPGVGGRLSDPLGTPPGELVRGLLSGPAVYHLWFVYALLGLYLVVPLLRALTDRPEPQRSRLIVWFLVLWFVADLLPRWGAFFLEDRFPVIYALPFEALPTGYVGLFVLGFALSHYRDRIRVPSAVWVLTALSGFAWCFTAVWQAARHDDPEIFAAYGNFNPPVVLYSVAVFAFFATRSRGPGPAWPLVLRLSELSFRVYLVHALVLHTLRVATDLGPLVAERPAVGLPVIYVATVMISVLVAWLLDFVRPLRRWV
jgi:surface polysaccharide O-acyltransferase-like enzyme